MKLYDFQKERYKKRAAEKLSRASWKGFHGHKIKNLPFLIMVCIFLLLVYFIPSPQGESFAGTALVTDGDTLQINGQRFRLYGIDAPESDQKCERGNGAYFCGEEATLALRRLVSGRTVVCEKQDTDRYNRIVAVCRTGDIELNKFMVVNGHAVSYRQYTGRYIIDEMKAKFNGIGVWSGSFQMPWDYRHRNK